MAEEMMEDEILDEEPILDEEEALAEEQAMGEEALPAEGGGTTIIHTPDELPDLANKTVGDTITMRVQDISDAGEYTLAIETELEAGPAEGMAGGDVSGRSAIIDAAAS